LPPAFLPGITGQPDQATELISLDAVDGEHVADVPRGHGHPPGLDMRMRRVLLRRAALAGLLVLALALVLAGGVMTAHDFQAVPAQL
jgi:hypothetical protein